MLRFAILVCGIPDQDVIERKGTFADMFVALLKDGDEEWKSFLVFQGEFPSEHELQQFHGIVITGSVGDAFGTEPWLVKLRLCIKKAANMGKRVLGVCFGHQVIATAFGARVGRAGYFECGARLLHRTSSSSSKSWSKFLKNGLVIHECHQDQVGEILAVNFDSKYDLLAFQNEIDQQLPAADIIEVASKMQVFDVPDGATVLATSYRCPIEIYSIGSNVLCFQGHPEFDSEVVVRLTNNRQELISSEDLKLRDESYQQLQPEQHYIALQQLCKAFLKD